MSEGPYHLHQVWETPPLSRCSKTQHLESKPYSISGRTYVFILTTDDSDIPNYVFVVRLSSSTQHTVKITVRVLGKKPLEFQDIWTFSQQTPIHYFGEFLAADQAKHYCRKDRLTLDVTIEHSGISEAAGPDYRTLFGYVGLKNQAATCYMNSMLQLLFHLPAFRKLVYGIPVDPSDANSIPLNLQQLFCLLEISPVAVETTALIQSFGWTAADAFQQHDVQEFLRVFLTKLGEKGASAEIAGLFGGTIVNYLRCIDVDYSWNKTEEFYDVQLVVKGNRGLAESLAQFVAEDMLAGSNQYQVDGVGQDAVRGCRFGTLPPILHIHLTRFEWTAVGQMKVSDRFEFPSVLDLGPFCAEATDAVYELFAVLAHLGGSFGGHYFACCRPSAAEEWLRFNDKDVGRAQDPFLFDSAYFLCYVRRSDIPWVMASGGDLPPHLAEFRERQRDALDPGMVRIAVVNVAGAELRLPMSATVSTLLREVRTLAPKSLHLWTVDAEGLPQRCLQRKETLQQALGGSARVFAADFEAADCALSVKFFFKGRKEPLQDLGFVPVTARATIDSVCPTVARLAGFNPAVKLRGFRLRGDRLLPLEPSDSAGPSGVLVFELVPGSAGAVSAFAFPPDAPGVFRLRDLLPGILDDPARFVAHVRLCRAVSVQCDGSNLIVELPLASQLRILLRCVRTALAVSDTEGVALYLPGSSALINSQGGVALSAVLPKRGPPALIARVVNGVAQAALDRWISVLFHLMSDSGDFLGDGSVDVPPEATVRDVLRKVRERKEVPDGMPLRMVAIMHSRIVAVLTEDRPIADCANVELRVEFAPEQPGLLVKCAYSHSRRFPPEGCFGRPFLLSVEEGEPLELTRSRVESLMAEPAWGTPELVLFRGRVAGRRFVVMEDGMELAEMAADPDAMLFVVIDRQVLLRWIQKSRETGLKIHN
jgi:ubiquitin C-terminal hydrolase